LKLRITPVRELWARRAPRGARGLKLGVHHSTVLHHLSRPARGAWIETLSREEIAQAMESRPARGAWIETLSIRQIPGINVTSRPARGAWIETPIFNAGVTPGVASRPARGAWIETQNALPRSRSESSRPARGAWIETN